MKRLSHFRFSRSQRSGIFFLGVCILVAQWLIRAGVFDPEVGECPEDDRQVELVNALVDSLKMEERVEYSPRPFNPNFMSDQKGYGFGMPVEAIDRLFRFRESGRYVNSAEEFQEVTGVHDTLLAAMAPYFQFPRYPKPATRRSGMVSRTDINRADTALLQKVHGIGPVLAERIVAYRERLGGYSVKDQLGEVYGLSEEVLPELWRKFHLDSPAVHDKFDLNTADLDQLASVPYISRSLAAKILAYRSMQQRVDSLGELTKFHNLSEKDLGRIGLYLTVE